jgi:hypothetical protein
VHAASFRFTIDTRGAQAKQQQGRKQRMTHLKTDLCANVGANVYIQQGCGTGMILLTISASALLLLENDAAFTLTTPLLRTRY